VPSLPWLLQPRPDRLQNTSLIHMIRTTSHRFTLASVRIQNVALLHVLFIWFITSGCSIRHYALNKVADALAQSGTTFSSDDDPELIKTAAPFSLKLMESLLAENP